MSLHCGKNGIRVHTNHRRKNPRHAGYGLLSKNYCRIEQRLIWKRTRQEARRLLHHEKPEMIPIWYPSHVRWDYW